MTFKEAEKALRRMMIIVEELKQDLRKARRIEDQKDILRTLLEKIAQRDTAYIN